MQRSHRGALLRRLLARHNAHPGAMLAFVIGAIAVVSAFAGCGSEKDGAPPPTSVVQEDAGVDVSEMDGDWDVLVDATDESDALSDGDSAGDAAGAWTGSPLFAQAASFEAPILANGDTATWYYPVVDEDASTTAPFPMVVVLPEQGIARGMYSGIGAELARYGFLVVVSDHETLQGMIPSTQQVVDVLHAMEEQASLESSPIRGLVDTSKLAVIGHGMGGVAGLHAIDEVCEPPYCSGSFSRPSQLLAGMSFGGVFGSQSAGVGSLENGSIPVGLMVGTLDTKVPLADVETFYQNTRNPPKALIRVVGSNHYGIADTDDPPGAPNEIAIPALAQATGIQSLGRFAAAFLRAHMLGESLAWAYVYAGAAADPNVNVTSSAD